MNRPFRLACAWPLLLASACTSTERPAAPPPGEPAGPVREPAPALPPAAPGATGIGDSLIPGQGNGGYDVQSYDLSLDLESAAGPLRGKAVIAARATQHLSAFNLDFHGLAVDAIEVNGAPATFAREGDELTVTPAASLPPEREFSVVVEYSGVPEGVQDPSMPFERIGWIHREGESYVFSQPNGAMTFFPCNDHPLDKALFTFRIRVPLPLEAVANGALVETLDEGAARTFVWKARDPMATYLATVAIADFEEQAYAGADGLRIVNYFTPSSKASARKAFERTDEILAFFSSSFGPYPFEIAGNILTSVPIPGALETQTKPVYGRGTGSEAIIAHELAHQWFGNAVCVEDWNDIWINEGISEYAAWMYEESQKGAEKFEEKVRGQYGMARSFKAPPPGKPTVTEMFGLGVYVRGPLVLHTLRRELGDEAFLGLMRAWVAEHLHGNASLEDFLELVERRAGAPARARIEPWLFDEQLPAVPEWDAYLDAKKAEADARRKAREEERRKKKAAAEAEQQEPATPPQDG